MDTIVFRGVTFRYKPSSDFVLKVDKYDIGINGIIGIFGNSGSGKTTLAKLIAGIESPSSGEIILGEELKDAVYIPQFPERVFVGGNVAKTVEIVLSRKGDFHNSFEFFRRVLNRFGLNYHVIRKRYGFELSAGELRKFALSLGFACNPDLLIIDEPSVGLDRRSKEKLIEILNELRQERMIIVSHDMHFLERVASSIYFLEAGKIVGRMSLEHYGDVVSDVKDDERES
ncbi:MAG: hypothetical protein DRP91_01910 [Candidatus Neomarinimicrobiota bacterium]|nr:energy-coupling factor ABC transporter ATP-binding protein [Candidatus Neomarinimicrobiota bacterium]RKY46592.1 MAG: hypothetical protein DRP88_06275 [Candidatus Neomarinimicrobiota bacterium]RKY50368.1 MAG: hypothetical protein DRP91_01910 [Candidatus Neomarinimicrobiota bacterium]RKY54260.1 MAG: hypothetical protein DRP92_01610 [Candidatus Neomarinimicrobiota bacterium]